MNAITTWLMKYVFSRLLAHAYKMGKAAAKREMMYVYTEMLDMARQSHWADFEAQCKDRITIAAHDASINALNVAHAAELQTVAAAVQTVTRIWPPTPDLAERATLVSLDENDAPMNPPAPLPVTPKADDPASSPPGVIL